MNSYVSPGIGVRLTPFDPAQVESALTALQSGRPDLIRAMVQERRKRREEVVKRKDNVQSSRSIEMPWSIRLEILVEMIAESAGESYFRQLKGNRVVNVSAVGEMALEDWATALGTKTPEVVSASTLDTELAEYIQLVYNRKGGVRQLKKEAYLDALALNHLSVCQAAFTKSDLPDYIPALKKSGERVVLSFAILRYARLHLPVRLGICTKTEDLKPKKK
jgi:hypothetical protein